MKVAEEIKGDIADEVAVGFADRCAGHKGTSTGYTLDQSFILCIAQCLTDGAAADL